METLFLDDELIEGPTVVQPRTPKTIPSLEFLLGPKPVPPPIPVAALLPVVPDAADPPVPPVYDTTPFVNDLTVTVNGTDWPQSRDRTVQVPINDAGTGQVVGLRSDPVALAVAPSDEIRFTLKGTAIFTGLADKITFNAITPEEEAGQLITVRCNGLLAEWADMILYPDIGAELPNRLGAPRQDTRIFNYSASTGVNDSSWDTATWTDPLYGEGIYQLFTRPESWPDRWARWIWDRDTTFGAPAGDVYFRRVFGTGAASPLPVQIWLAADAKGEVLLNGIPIAEIPGPYTGASQHVDITLGPHFHLLAAKLTNVVGRAGFTYSILPIDGDRLGTPILRSDPATKVLGYTTPPTFTAGRIIFGILDEAQFRGGMVGWTLAFDDDVDSNGEPWEPIENYSVRVGLDGLSFLKQMSEQHIDFVCSPTARVLHAYRVGTLGGVSGANLIDPAHMRGLTIETG